MKKKIILLVCLLMCCGRAERREETVRIAQSKEFFSVRVLGLFKPSRVRLAICDDMPVWVVPEAGMRQARSLPAESQIRILGKDLLSVISGDSDIIAKSQTIRFAAGDQSDYYGGFLLEVAGKIRRKYIGGLKVIARSGELLLLVTQRLEDLVTTTLASESSVEDSLEYLKAQAVISRTFVVANLDRHKEEGFDFCDNTHCQVFFGEDKQHCAFRQAAVDTRGKVLVYRNEIVDVFFTGACGGETATPQQIWSEFTSSYLYQSVKCGYCADSRFFRWRTEVEKSKLATCFFGGVGSNLTVRIRQRFGDGRPQSVVVTNGGSQIALSADRFRTEVGRSLGWDVLYSDWFDMVQSEGRSITFEGHGFGHGIGFCQEGGKKLGKMGKSAYQILHYYYPNASVGIAATDRR